MAALTIADGPARGFSRARAAAGRGRRSASFAASTALAIAGCVSVDGVQTPYGDVSPARPEPDEGSARADAGAPPGVCDRAWTTLRFGSDDQRAAWSAPSLTATCADAPYRLTAIAPSLGAGLNLSLSRPAGRVIEALYSSTSTGPDGELWGEYEAFIDVTRLTFGAATATRQPFELVGTIFGPFGPVTIEALGCATLRVLPC